MTAITFDTTTVDSIEVTHLEMKGDASGNYGFECTVLAQTETFANYTALVAKTGLINKTLLYSGKTSIQTIAGTKGSLIMNGNTYTNCYIENISAAEAPWSNLGVWRFTISFVKDTSA